MSIYNRNNYRRGRNALDPISEDKTEQLKKAIKTGMNILGYSDNTERQLHDKLIKKGYHEDVIVASIEYLIEKGYLNEERHINRAIIFLADTKLLGRRRIYEELKKKGFSREKIENADFSEIDFPQNCAKLIFKRRRTNRISFSGDEDTEELRNILQKEYASLLRYGYSGDDIKRAYKILKAEENN